MRRGLVKTTKPLLIFSLKTYQTLFSMVLPVKTTHLMFPPFPCGTLMLGAEFLLWINAILLQEFSEEH